MCPHFETRVCSIVCSLFDPNSGGPPQGVCGPRLTAPFRDWVSAHRYAMPLRPPATACTIGPPETPQVCGMMRSTGVRLANCGISAFGTEGSPLSCCEPQRSGTLIWPICGAVGSLTSPTWADAPAVIGKPVFARRLVCRSLCPSTVGGCWGHPSSDCQRWHSGRCEAGLLMANLLPGFRRSCELDGSNCHVNALEGRSGWRGSAGLS